MTPHLCRRMAQLLFFFTGFKLLYQIFQQNARGFQNLSSLQAG
jgi:hypothetical protein